MTQEKNNLDKHLDSLPENNGPRRSAVVNPRFIIIEESFSGHCCFEYSIIDTSISVDADPYRKRGMCETFDKDNAETICNALNKL